MKAMIIAAAAIALSATPLQENNFSANQPLLNVSAKPLVQEFGYFRVHRMGNDASLNWSVTDPLNADFFSIERSYDGTNFESLCDVECAGNATHRYRDNTVFPGYIYYRIKSYQHDGSMITSPVEMLRIVKRG